MPVRFKPFWGLTIITLIFCAILFSLGTWQYKRLFWKADLLVAIDKAANAPPLTSLAQARQSLEDGEPLDFRRIELHGEFVTPHVNGGVAFHLMRSNGKKFYWRLYQPYLDGADYAFIATNSFDEGEKASPPAELTGKSAVIGYVRMVQKANRFTPKPTVEKNRWFAFNGSPDLLDWAKVVPGETVETRFFVDQEFTAPSAAFLPVRKPDVPNNHLDYMLTWYSFIVILLVIYFIIHHRAGRLRFGRTSKKPN